MSFRFDFSPEKNQILKESRGVGFDDIVSAIESGKLLDNKNNPNQKRYPDQKLFVVRIKNYAYAVPYVIDKERQVCFLKTLYPSRKLTKQYIKKI